MSYEIVLENKVIEVDTTPVTVDVTAINHIIEVSTNQIAIQGEPGPAGADGLSFQSDEILFPTPSFQWIVNHNKGYQPSLIVLDSAGNEYSFVQINRTSPMQAILSFDVLFSGSVIVN